MGVMAAFFARALRIRLGRPYTGFLPIRQEVRAIGKTRNQLHGNKAGKYQCINWFVRD
jgi:hypothetical protein